MSNFASGYIKYINHLEQINDAAINNPEKMISEVEGSYSEHLENIARNIASQEEKIKVCMLSGPSSSGKTTTARFFKEKLAKFGINAHIVSMDNYYLDRELIPFKADGTQDFETVTALDIAHIEETILNAVNNKTITVPNYSFKEGKAVGESEVIDIGENDMIILEGIHGLNPIFTKHVAPEKLCKLYVSVKQQIKDVNGEVISPFDIRLTRRIVRDMQFRSTSPERTLSMWDSVNEGEDRYIRPYRLSADYTVNSIHIYEPCVLRTIAIPILREIAEDSLYYRKARDLESRLMRFEPVSPSLVPETSLLKEFIG